MADPKDTEKIKEIIDSINALTPTAVALVSNLIRLMTVITDAGYVAPTTEELKQLNEKLKELEDLT